MELTQQTYHQRQDIIGSSMFKVFRDSPYKYWATFIKGELKVIGPTPEALSQGSLIHAVVLEGLIREAASFKQRFAIWNSRVELDHYRYKKKSGKWSDAMTYDSLPQFAKQAQIDGDKSTTEHLGKRWKTKPRIGSEWDAFLAECHAKHLIDITHEQLERSNEIHEGVFRNQDAVKLLATGGKVVEQPFDWKCESGIHRKYMGDCQWPDRGWLFDLKTTRELSSLVYPDGTLSRNAERLGYPHQLAWYCEGFREQYGKWPTRAGWIICDKDSRETVIAEIDPDQLKRVEYEINRPDLVRLEELMRTRGEHIPWQDVFSVDVSCSEFLLPEEQVEMELADGSKILV